MSFYKILGYPTGLGALLVRNSSADVLQKCYFGGGTIEVALATERFDVRRRDLSERFEDGTLPFLEILAVKHGLEALFQFAGPSKEIGEHCFRLASWLYWKLSTLRHSNGRPLVILYHLTEFKDMSVQGPVVTFNLLRSNGNYVGFAQVEKLADVHNIHVRTGCFCNTGAGQRHLQVTTPQIMEFFRSGKVCGDDIDLIGEQPTGAVRVSLGYTTTICDVLRLVRFIEECFMEENTPTRALNQNGTAPRLGNRNRIATTILVREATVAKSYSLSDMYIYPVKSASAVQLDNSVIGRKGLLYDREWLVVGEGGVAVSQKRAPLMSLIRSTLVLQSGTMTLQAPRTSNITVSLRHSLGGTVVVPMCKHCGDKPSPGVDCGDDVARWLQSYLGLPGLRLIRQIQNDDEPSSGEPDYDAQYLLIGTASVHAILSIIRERKIKKKKQSTSENFFAAFDNADNSLSFSGLVERFRPNLVVNTEVPFEEDTWSKIRIGSSEFESKGSYARCQMVCVDQRSGRRGREPLRAMASIPTRKATFGIILCRVGSVESDTSDVKQLRVGDSVEVLSRTDPVVSTSVVTDSEVETPSGGDLGLTFNSSTSAGIRVPFRSI